MRVVIRNPIPYRESDPERDSELQEIFIIYYLLLVYEDKMPKMRQASQAQTWPQFKNQNFTDNFWLYYTWSWLADINDL